VNIEPLFVNQLVKRRKLLGTPRNKLSVSQLEHFADRGTHWHILQDYIAEFGVSPEENDRLARIGL